MIAEFIQPFRGINAFGPLPASVAGSGCASGRRQSAHFHVTPSVRASSGSLCQQHTKMANVVLEFKASAGDSEPQSRPVLIIGQQNNLQQVTWSQIKGKLQPVVSKEVIFCDSGS